MRHFILLAVVIGCSLANPTLAFSSKAKSLHFSSIVIDTHDDTTQRLLDPAFDVGTRHIDGNVDIPRMREGGLDAIFFSVWIPGTVTGPIAVKRALNQIDTIREQVRKHPKDLMLATTASDIEKAHTLGKIAALIGVEGGHMIDNDLSVLRSFAALGVRYLTLTHTQPTDWADASTESPMHNGLTEFGEEVVAEMNRLGMLVDVSHVSDKTFYDALKVSKAPVFASHSSCRALNDAPRNMSDEMIKALAKRGGVVQINFHAAFLSQQRRDAEAAHPEVKKQIEDEIKKRCANNPGCETPLEAQMLRQFEKNGSLPKVEWSQIVDHIDHAVKIAGVDHVGLGSDFDGAIMPIGMDDASHLPKITEALLSKGYSSKDIRKILGGNTLRLMREVERVSRDLNLSRRLDVPK